MGGKILVIDDNDRHLDILCAMLGAADFEAEACASGEAALKRLAEETFDALMLDLLMPEIDGFDILDALARGSNARTPVVVVTANIDLARRDLLGRREVKAIVEKPVRTMDLLSAALRAMASRAEVSRVWTPALAVNA